MLRKLAVWVKQYSYFNWALVDQVMVSGSNFLTGILLARFLGLEGYGQFVLLYAVLLYANTIQGAIVLAPMMSIFPKIYDADGRARYASGILTFQLLFASAIALLLVVLGYVLNYYWPEWQLEHYLLPLCTTVIFFQLQDWLRRYLFSDFRSGNIIVNDLICYGGRLLVLIMLSLAGVLSVSAALWAVGATSALAFGIGWANERIAIHFKSMGVVFWKNLPIARDLLISGQLQWAATQGLLMMSASILGTEALGGIRAAQHILGPFNILNNVILNIVPTRAARLYRDNGYDSLIQYLQKLGNEMGVVVLGFGIIISVFSKAIMSVFYGEKYINYAHLVIWGVGFWLLSIIATQFSIYHRIIESSNQLSKATILFAVTSILIVIETIDPLKEISIFLAAIMGQSIFIIYLWYTASRREFKS